MKSILKILFYFVFSKYFLVVFCTSLAVAAAAAVIEVSMSDVSESEEVTDDGRGVQTLPEVPDDGVLIKTLFAGVCHATHSPQRQLDLASLVGQFFSDDKIRLNKQMFIGLRHSAKCCLCR